MVSERRFLHWEKLLMKVLRKITITSVRERSLVLRSLDSSAKGCLECNGFMVPATWAAARSPNSLRSICRSVEAEQVHYTEGPEGLLICMQSLANTSGLQASGRMSDTL